MMGVSCILNYQIAEGKSGQQTVDAIQKCLEHLGAFKNGNFLIDCETYNYQLQNSSQIKAVHVLHNSEQLASTFAFIDNPSGTNIIADITFDLLIQKMKQFYTKKQPKIESRGSKYSLGDFVIKVGSVVMGQMATFKGLLIEIEYQPCIIGSECLNLIKEFTDLILTPVLNQNTHNINLNESFTTSNLVDNCNLHFKSRLENVYGASDTIQQYLEHFLNLRSASSTNTSNQQAILQVQSIQQQTQR